MDEETYDEKIIDMYLDALDRKVPMPNHPDADTAYDLFLKARGFEPEKGRRRDFRFVSRAALAAVIAALLFGAMVTVQAAGVDVFSKIAEWTRDMFHFGEETFSNGHDAPKGNGDRTGDDAGMESAGEISEFQKALDDHGITGVKAPSRLPDGFAPDKVLVTDLNEAGMFVLNVLYRNSDARINIVVTQGNSSAPAQIQNNKEIVDSYTINGIDLFVIQNENNQAVTWAVDGYEYQVIGGGVDQLKLIAESMLID